MQFFFVLNNNTVYCSVIFPNCKESTQLITFLYKGNCIRKRHGDCSQIPAKREKKEGDRQTPPKRHHSLVCISCFRTHYSQNLTFLFLSHGRRIRAVKRDGHCIQAHRQTARSPTRCEPWKGYNLMRNDGVFSLLKHFSTRHTKFYSWRNRELGQWFLVQLLYHRQQERRHTRPTYVSSRQKCFLKRLATNLSGLWTV